MNQRGGTVTKLVIFLALLGLVGYEAGALLIARVQASGTADTAASEAALTWDATHSTTKTKARAKAVVEDQGGAELVSVTIGEDGQTVTVTVAKIAKTIFVQHFGSLKKKRRVEASSEARVP